MRRLDKNVVMLWCMALALALVILISRQLMAHGLHPLHMALIQALGSFVSILAVRRGALPALSMLRNRASYFGWASLLWPGHAPVNIGNADGDGGQEEEGMPGSKTAASRTQPRGREEGRARDGNRQEVHLSGMEGFHPKAEGNEIGDNEGHGVGQCGQSNAGVGHGGKDDEIGKGEAQGLRPTEVALATTLVATLTFTLLALLLPVHTPMAFFIDARHGGLLLLFMALAGLGQLLLFHLQEAAGPVFIGQTGALVALFGGVLGFVFFGETYTAVTLLGSLLIILGVYNYCQVTAALAMAKANP